MGPGWRYLSTRQALASKCFSGKNFSQSGCFRLLPVVTGCGGRQPGQILDKSVGLQTRPKPWTQGGEWPVQLDCGSVRSVADTDDGTRGNRAHAARMTSRGNAANSRRRRQRKSTRLLPSSTFSCRVPWGRRSAPFTPGTALASKTVRPTKSARLWQTPSKRACMCRAEFCLLRPCGSRVQKPPPGFGRTSGNSAEKAGKCCTVFCYESTLPQGLSNSGVCGAGRPAVGYSCIFCTSNVDTKDKDRWEMYTEHAFDDGPVRRKNVRR